MKHPTAVQEMAQLQRVEALRDAEQAHELRYDRLPTASALQQLVGAATITVRIVVAALRAL